MKCIRMYPSFYVIIITHYWWKCGDYGSDEIMRHTYVFHRFEAKLVDHVLATDVKHNASVVNYLQFCDNAMLNSLYAKSPQSKILDKSLLQR